MVKTPRKQNLVKHLKKEKVEVHHPQNPRHPMTSEEFLLSWFCTKISHNCSEAFCCHASKEEEKNDDLPLAPSSEELIKSIPQEVNACEEKVMFTNDDLLLGDTPHNRPLYLVGYMRDERVNRILFDGGSLVNILPIGIVKELGIPMNELSESHVMIQGFNHWGQRSIVAIRLGITIEDMQLIAWLHVIDAKTSYNVLLGRPWIHENKVVPSTYYQCLKYYEGEVEKKIVADDKSFTDTESHFVGGKFYLKNRIVKELKPDDITNGKNDESTTKRAEVVADKTKDVAKEVHPGPHKSHKGNIVSHNKKVTFSLQYVPRKNIDKGELSNLQTNMLKGLTLPIKWIEAVKLSSKLLRKSVSQNSPQDIAFPTKRTDEGFDPNAYKLFANAGYNPNEPSKLGKLPSEAATRQPHEDEDVKGTPYELEEGVKTTVDALKEVNLGTDEEPRPTYLSDLLAIDEERTYMELLKEFKDVFAWSYKEMPGLDPKVAVHHLAVKNGTCPVKKAQRRFRPDLVPLIESEVNKLIEAGFIREVKYPIWISSIVPVRKKNGQI
ncbi:uncharacterized protein [Nicotiana tomentosiformis]|uniref:uncharacterized protein n=1 Tax=Nicotiana tomentosiformis TaxID=4098 RepID=UPI00388CBA90